MYWIGTWILPVLRPSTQHSCRGRTICLRRLLRPSIHSSTMCCQLSCRQTTALLTSPTSLLPTAPSMWRGFLSGNPLGRRTRQSWSKSWNSDRPSRGRRTLSNSPRKQSCLTWRCRTRRCCMGHCPRSLSTAARSRRPHMLKRIGVAEAKIPGTPLLVSCLLSARQTSPHIRDEGGAPGRHCAEPASHSEVSGSWAKHRSEESRPDLSTVLEGLDRTQLRDRSGCDDFCASLR
mmetsp:Transcript_4902/g.14724  ORF Transcript_4902/g.14724 Transcript_4902/m.14724 type:complete len:233 (+) Transcript_4902:290-988(+)